MEARIQEQQRQKEEQQARALQEEKRRWQMQEQMRIEQLKPTADTLMLSAEEAFKRRLDMSKSLGSVTAEVLEEQEQSEKEAAAKIKAETERKMSFAERMMAKQGWEHGQGLGKRSDGVAAPLEVLKVQGSKTVGVISQAAVVKPGGASRKKGNTKITGAPTKIVLLRNLVGRGEVDPGLKGEVARECQKYGDVKGIEIYEDADPSTSQEEAVRVFIKFQRGPEAVKAVVELDGRSFDSRVISACFYDETKYELKLFTKQPEEPPLPAECRSKKS
eukprot:TRINITY_DN3573_c0_g1_i4.p1 TRINITY_DN3573_c0_g1~~TRINITY_DN3573_c0_g1_i4.p1  ORF type:complete len:275 (+),score=86.64 TRINITY_DN3573_c0_g1_i4:335-1159(+)